MVTERIEGVTPDLPTLRDPDRLTYWKEEVGGLVWGGYEPNPKAWAKDGIPEDFHFQLLNSDWDHYSQFMQNALARVPALATAGVKQLINGPESFTPDGNFILGEAPELRNLFVGAGFNAFGIASGGGAGMALAEWAAKGEPPFDLWPVDIRRFGRVHHATDWVRARTMEAYSITPSPGRPRNITRPVRCGGRRFMPICRRRGPVSAKSWGGSVPTGSPIWQRANGRWTAIPFSVPAGSRPWRASIAPRAGRRC
jgi:hypothetical protein